MKDSSWSPATSPLPGIYLLNFLTIAFFGAIAPLLPLYVTHFSLSKVEAGAIVASPSVATLLLSIPIGLLADRLGARPLTVAAAILLAVSAFGQLLVGDFGSLISVWVLFGVAMAIVTTASIAWLSESASSARRVAALGAVATTSGLGIMAGPGLAGTLVDHFGLKTPFVAVGVAAVAVTVALLVGGRGNHVGEVPRLLRLTLRPALSEPRVVGSLALAFVAGMQGGVISLLVSLRLHANGLSAGEIGYVFSGSLVIFILASALLVGMGERAARLAFGGIGVLLLGGSLILPIATNATAWLVVFLCLRAPLWAVLSTLSLPLGVVGAHAAGLARGGVIGILNVAWGVGAVFGPLVGGTVAQSVGQRAAYVGLAACCLATAAAVLAADRTSSDERTTRRKRCRTLGRGA
jgi:MFS family permease